MQNQLHPISLNKMLKILAIAAQAFFVLEDIVLLPFLGHPLSVTYVIYHLLWKSWHILLIFGFLFHWRRILFLGLIVGMATLSWCLRNLLYFYSFYPDFFISTFLWLVTSAAIIRELTQSPRKSAESVQPKRVRNKAGVIIAIGIGLLLPLLFIKFFGWALNEGMSKHGGKAPDGNFKQRQQWAKRTSGYNEYFKYVHRWIEDSELITSYLGKVTAVAPLDSPNYYQGCFTDGCHAAMNLEVVGEKGTGFLYLPYVGVSDSGLVRLGEATWTFLDKTEIIDNSGKEYLKNAGLRDQYERLMSPALDKDIQQFVAGYEELKKIIGSRDVRWPEFYLLLMIRRFAQAFEAQGDTGKAVELYLKAIERREDNIRNQLFGPREDDLNPEILKKELAQVLEDLRRCRTLAPTNKMLGFYAENRVIQGYAASVGTDSFYAPDVPSPRVRDAWGKKVLGDFYLEAVQWLKDFMKAESNTEKIKLYHSPRAFKNGTQFSEAYYGAAELKERIGKIKTISPKKDYSNQIYINGNYYGAVIALEILGTKGNVSLSFFVEDIVSVDLYADDLPLPSVFLEIKNVEEEYNL